MTFTKFNSCCYEWICKPLFISGLPIFHFNIVYLITGTFINEIDRCTILNIHREQVTRDLSYTEGIKIK